MGVYLSSPITDKESIDEKCEGFVYGASSMQGWRTTQEDAHNCIPVFDEATKTSFFAVYDGHGGSEVAKYCELHFPKFVKEMMESSMGPQTKDSSGLIQNAFLAFDATLTTDEVIKELKELAGKDDEVDEEEEDDPVGYTETDRLKEEATMPLEQLLAQYQTDKSAPGKKESFQSPALRAKTANMKTGENGGKDTSSKPSTESRTSSSISSSSSSAAMAASSASAEPSSSSSEDHTTLTNGKTELKESDQSQPASGGTNNSNNNNNNNNNKVDKPGVSVEQTEESACSKSSEAGSSQAEGAGSSGCSVSADSSQRSSKLRAAAGLAATTESSDDDDDDDDEEEEDMWEDMSDDDEEDEEEEEEEEEVPMMDMTNEEPGSDSGCTACVVLIQDKKVIVANSGDSRCVLARAGKAIDLSFDHKPEDDIERERIEKAGGKVTADGRVNGGLNLSRAIGDHVYKRNGELPAKDQMITALPDIETAQLGDEDQFLVIACDGIWNYMSSQEVVDYILVKLKDPEKRKNPSVICEELFDHCLAPNTFGDGTGCDNMTCIIVLLDTYSPTDSNSTPSEVKVTNHEASQPQGSILKDFHNAQEEPATGDGSSESSQAEQMDKGMKRCSENVESGEEKRLKREEEVV